MRKITENNRTTKQFKRKAKPFGHLNLKPSLSLSYLTLFVSMHTSLYLYMIKNNKINYDQFDENILLELNACNTECYITNELQRDHQWNTI